MLSRVQRLTNVLESVCLASVCLVGSVAACSSTTEEPSPREDRVTEPERAGGSRGKTQPRSGSSRSDDRAALPPSRYPQPRRLVAIGDVHGDVSAFRQALRTAGAIGDGDRWIGGDLFLVQTGDVLDRGDDEPEILALIRRLEREATNAGGRFVALNGNHELMNTQLDFRYVTPDGFRDYAGHAAEADGEARRLPRAQRGRGAAFQPRSAIARQLAARNTVVVVGDTVLLHGGLTPAAAAIGLDAINRAARDFFLGRAPISPILASPESPIWYRGYAGQETRETCAELRRALETVHASRMVIGHTVQERGISHACAGRVFRIDVGLARYYAGPIQALEITAPYSPAMGGMSGTRVLEGSRN